MEDEERKKKTRKLDNGGHRDWSELQELPLAYILDHLLSLADFFAFAAICRSWRSVALSRQEATMATRPPLLLRPILQQSREWTNPPQCRLDSPINRSLSFRCPLSFATLNAASCIGYSFGNLILLNRRQIIIADVFTAHQIHAPTLLGDTRNYTLGFLTARPSSPDCWLVLMSPRSHFILNCWRLSGGNWTQILLDRRVEPPITGIVVFNGILHALDSHGSLLTITSSPQPSVELWGEDQLGSTGLSLPVLPVLCGYQQLVECGGNLLLVYFTRLVTEIQIQVYRLDSSHRSWMKVESLGDWSLFMDIGGRCAAVSCMAPARWGGRSNCIYVTGPESDTWSVFPFDGSQITYYSNESRLVWLLPSWPYPLWVYPSMFF